SSGWEALLVSRGRSPGLARNSRRAARWVSPRRLLDAEGGVYVNGHLLFIRQTSVFAQEFDAERLELKGSPFQVADGVFSQAGGFYVPLSGSTGAFAFRAGAARFIRQFTWVDRSGNSIATVGDRLGNPDGISWYLSRAPPAVLRRGSCP